jgi:hypothetical protein
MRASWVVFTMLFVAALAAVAAWVVPWHFEGNLRAIRTSACVGMGAIILAILGCWFGNGISRGLGIALAVIAGVAVITQSFIPSDLGAPHNRWVRAARVVQKVIQRNREYAKRHQGTFANSLDQLGAESSTDQYTIMYQPASDADHVVRHYVVRAISLSKEWPRSLYADESGVIRFSDGARAEKDSTPI